MWRIRRGRHFFILACSRGHEFVVKALVDAGANVNTVNKHGWLTSSYCVSIRT